MVASLHIPTRVVEISAGLPSGAAISFRDLWCSFDVKSFARKKPNEATVKIYNVSESTARWLEQPNLTLTVNAGFDVPGQLFQGAISRDGVVTTNANEEWVTTIVAADGRRAYRDSIFLKSYPPATAALTMIRDIATAMNKPVTFSAVQPTYVFPFGVAFAEKARSALDQVLAAAGGLRWTIIGGVLYILDPLGPVPGNAPVVTPQSGLHGSPQRTKKGAKFTCDLNPAIVAARGVVLKSRMLSGTYRVEELNHQGDTWGTVWQTMTMGTKV
jgi:hypothetical protein